MNKIGETYINNQNLKMTIVEYNNCRNIMVEFEDGYRKKTRMDCIKNGSVYNPNFPNVNNKKQGRIGEERYNTKGDLMKIIEYKDSYNVVIEFQDSYKAKKNIRYDNFINGTVKNPYHKDLYGIGYFGEGNYSDKEHHIYYRVWQDMIKRCYDKETIKKRPTYKQCEVCEEWHNFQNFAKWCDKNYYESSLKKESMQLDKDILFKGNKTYSPDTCIFVPQRINSLFIKSDKARGDYPIGVTLRKDNGKYRSQCDVQYGEEPRKQIKLGQFDTPEEAFYAYKQFKENYIKEVTDLYKPYIPQKLYEAMYKYEVEIDD